MATLFPQYDFAKEIAGKHAEVTLLLPPGVESHTYEPTPADIVKINAADMFIYTGKYMEQWAERIMPPAAIKLRLSMFQAILSFPAWRIMTTMLMTAAMTMVTAEAKITESTDMGIFMIPTFGQTPIMLW